MVPNTMFILLKPLAIWCQIPCLSYSNHWQYGAKYHVYLTETTGNMVPNTMFYLAETTGNMVPNTMFILLKPLAIWCQIPCLSYWNHWQYGAKYHVYLTVTTGNMVPNTMFILQKPLEIWRQIPCFILLKPLEIWCQLPCLSYRNQLQYVAKLMLL